MVSETEKRQKLQEKEPKRISIPVFTRNSGKEILLVRDAQPQKYLPNNWSFLLPRQFLGETTPHDLHNLAKDLGLVTKTVKSIFSIISRDGFHNLSDGRPAKFDFCELPVVGGEFNPKLIYSENPDSIYNYLITLEGKWFAKKELARESHLDPLVQSFLDFTKTQ